MEDIEMTDIDDEGTVQTITLEISKTRKDQHQLRKNQPYDILNQKLPAEIRLLFIVDTNFAISHLTIVRRLVDLYDSSKCLVLIPWVVVQELDGLKSASKTYGQANLALLARNAVSFIHETLASGRAGLRGQKISECLDREADFGDDAILDCARYWHERQRVDVVMLSNDKNLCTKFMIHGLGAVSYEMGLNAEKLIARILRHWQPQTRETATTDESMVVDNDQQDKEDDDNLVLFTTPPPPVEMQTDPVLPPIIKPIVDGGDDPFAALSARAGVSRYERSAKAVPLRKYDPPDTSDGVHTIGDRADTPAGRLLHDVEQTMLEVLPDLVRAVLLDALDRDEAAVAFLLPPATTTDLPTLVRSLEGLPCRLGGFRLRRDEAEEMTRTLQERDCSPDRLPGVVASLTDLWLALSGHKKERYRARRDRTIEAWQTQCRAMRQA